MTFKYETISEIQLEITTYCNASCPQCPRNLNGGSVNPYMPLEHLPRNVIDKAFDKSFCKRLNQIFFCGSYGDPIMHPEFLDIVKDFRKKSHTLWIYIHTNGGVRKPEWWAELAEVINGYGKIDFGIDGLENTNHLYRRGVHFNRVIENAKSFINAGGKAQWNYIVFEHNEHEIEDAKKLSQDLGFEDILIRATGRFLNHKTLEEMPEWPVAAKNNGYTLKIPKNNKYRNQSMLNLPKLKEEYNDIKDYFNETKIKCDACVGNKAVVTAEGLVLPCNFFEHNLYDARFRKDTFMPSANQLHFENGKNQVEQFIDQYGKENLNIKNHSLEDIFKNQFWQDLILSWDKKLGEGRIFECAFSCGQKLTKIWDQNKKMTNTYRYYVTGNNRGLGKAIAEKFSADGTSRQSGLDITKDVDAIAEESLHYDVFVNNAFDGPPDCEWANYAQVNLLMAVYKKWKAAGKTGWIFNIGSIGEKTVVAPEPDFETYRVAKSALAYASKQCTRSFKDNHVGFKTTLITPDRLDTELSRSRESWTGNGIDCNDICNFIDWCVNINLNTAVEEVTLCVNFDYKK